MLLFSLLFYIHASFSFIYSSIFFQLCVFPPFLKSFFFSDILCNSFFFQSLLSIFFLYSFSYLFKKKFFFYVSHSFFYFPPSLFLPLLIQHFGLIFNYFYTSLAPMIPFWPPSFSFTPILCNILLLIIFRSCFAFPNANQDFFSFRKPHIC